MKTEPLTMNWSCSCQKQHNCVVIDKIGPPLDISEIAQFAAENNAFCPNDDEAGDDTFFIRAGKFQESLEQDGLFALVRSLQTIIRAIPPEMKGG